MKQNIISTLCVLLLILCSASFIGEEAIVESGLRYHEITFKASHNSYERPETIAQQLTFNPNIPSDDGCLGLEFDIYRDRDYSVSAFRYFRVSHDSPSSDSETLQFYLNEVINWHNQNPDHLPVLITLDVKDSGAYTSFHEAIDTYLQQHFEEDLIFKPNELMQNSQLSLVQNVNAYGWPLLSDMTGKFIFCLSGNEDIKKEYATNNLEERFCFSDQETKVNEEPGNPGDENYDENIVFYNFHIYHHNRDDWMVTIPLYCEKNFITRAWVANSLRNFRNSITAKVSAIATDKIRYHSWAKVSDIEPYVYKQCFYEPCTINANLNIPDEVCFGDPIPVSDISTNYEQYHFTICAVGQDDECLPFSMNGNRVESGWIDGPIGEIDLEEAYNEWSNSTEEEHNWFLWCFNNNTEESFIRYKVTLCLRGQCQSTEIEEFITVSCYPEPDYSFTDINGNIKTEFCEGETVLLDASDSRFQEEWFLSIWQYEIGGFAQGQDRVDGGYCKAGEFTDVDLGIIPLNEIWNNCAGNTINFVPGFEYRVQLAVRNDCSPWVAKEDEVFIVQGIPIPDYIITDENGQMKTEFCVGETVLLDASGSQFEEEWFLSIWQFEIGGLAAMQDPVDGGYCKAGDFSDDDLGIISLNQIWDNCAGNTIDFEPGFEYRVQLAVRNQCSNWEAKEDEVFIVRDVPVPDYIFTDENGDIKTEFCAGETVLLDASGSQFEEEWFLSIWQFEIGGLVAMQDPVSGGYCKAGEFADEELGIIPLNEIWDNCPGNTNVFEPGYEYRVQLAVRNNCSTWEAKEDEVFIVRDVPIPDYTFRDQNGNIKTEFCEGETIILDGTSSHDEDSWFLSVWKYEIGGFASNQSGLSYCKIDWTPGEVGSFQLNPSVPLWSDCTQSIIVFEPGYEYRVQLAVRNQCSEWEAKEDEVIVVLDCSDDCLTSTQNSNFGWAYLGENKITAVAVVDCDPCKVTEINWYYGDANGNTDSQKSRCPNSVGPQVFHTYDFCGTYNLCVEIISVCPDGKCPIKMCQEVVIENDCIEREFIEGFTTINSEGGNSIKPFKLTNSPNPFKQQTKISYFLDAKQKVSLAIYDLQGNIIRNLASGELQDSGQHNFDIDTDNLTAGTYICVLKSADQVETLKLIKLQ